MTDSQVPNQPGAENNPGADGKTNELPAVELNAAWPPPAAQTAWATPFEEKPTYKKRGALLAAGAALVTVLGVTSVAMAANSADDDDDDDPTAAAAATPSASTDAKGNPSDDRPMQGNRGRHGGHGLGHGLGKNLLHGEAVVKTADGYATMLNQLGEVTAVSATSITVKSEDGFTDTYAIPAATATDSGADDSADSDDDDAKKPKKVRIDRDVAVGDTVRVVATQGSGDPVVVMLKERGAGNSDDAADDADDDADDDGS